MSTELTVSIAFLVKSNGKDEKRTETVKRELLKKGIKIPCITCPDVVDYVSVIYFMTTGELCPLVVSL